MVTKGSLRPEIDAHSAARIRSIATSNQPRLRVPAGFVRFGRPVSLGLGRSARFVENADLAVFVVTLWHELVGGNLPELADRVNEEGLQVRGGLAVVAMGAAGRLGDDLVDDAEAAAGRGSST